jgi:hypothetical protein
MDQRRSGQFRNQFGVAATIFLGVALISGCAATPTTTSTTPATATSTAVPASQPADITEQTNHGTVNLHTGQVVRLSLQSTYWSDPVSSLTSVVAADGRVSRVRSGRCPIGGGCGTVSVRFRAEGPGTARLQAHRSSCGEAMGCSPSQQEFTVTVVVS